MEEERQHGLVTVYCAPEQGEPLKTLLRALPANKLAGADCKVRALPFSTPAYGRAVLLKGSDSELAGATKGLTAFLTSLSGTSATEALWVVAADPEATEHKIGSNALEWSEISAFAMASINRMLQHTPSACWMPAWLAELWQAAAVPDLPLLPELMPAVPEATDPGPLGPVAADQFSYDGLAKGSSGIPEQLAHEARDMLRNQLSPTVKWHLFQQLGEFYEDCVDFKEWSVLNHMETEWNAILNDLFTPPIAYKVCEAINRLRQAFKDAREAKRVAAPLSGSVVQQIASDVNLIFHHMPAPEGNQEEACIARQRLTEGQHLAVALHAKCQTVGIMADTATPTHTPRLNSEYDALAGPFGAGSSLGRTHSLRSSSSGLSISDRMPAATQAPRRPFAPAHDHKNQSVSQSRQMAVASGKPVTTGPPTTTPVPQPTAAMVTQESLKAHVPATAPLPPAIGDWGTVPDFPQQMVVPMLDVPEPEADICSWNSPQRTPAEQNADSQGVPHFEGSWLEMAKKKPLPFAENVMTFEEMLVACTQLLHHSVEVHKDQQPCNISHGQVQYLACHLLPATMCCARNLRLLATAGSKEAAAEEVNIALAAALRGLTNDAAVTNWHAAKMPQVDSIMAMRTVEGEALVPVIAAVLERISNYLMDILDLEIV